MSKNNYPAKLTTGYYRVRMDWEDEASQLGAYRLLANAKVSLTASLTPDGQTVGLLG